MGPVLAVLHTNGTHANTTKRPSGTFYMCGPLQGLNGDACTAKTCGPHSHADYSNTGWDQGHMVSNHEGGLFAGGEQDTFSMCNIWYVTIFFFLLLGTQQLLCVDLSSDFGSLFDPLSLTCNTILNGLCGTGPKGSNSTNNGGNIWSIRPTGMRSRRKV